MDWSDRLQVVFASFLQAAILLLAINLFLQGFWLSAFTGSLVFVLTFIPAILERQLSVYLPVEFSLVTAAFLYAAFALGEVREI